MLSAVQNVLRCWSCIDATGKLSSIISFYYSRNNKDGTKLLSKVHTDIERATHAGTHASDKEEYFS